MTLYLITAEVKYHVSEVLVSVVVALVGAMLYVVKLLILHAGVTTWLTWTLDLTIWLDSEVKQHVCKVLMSV